MKIHFYGTSASEGVPAIFCECDNCKKIRTLRGRDLRTRTSCGINSDLLVDFSPDSFGHALYGGLNLWEINHILVTHPHADHLYPQDLYCVAPPFATYRRERSLTVHGGTGVEKRLREKTCSSAQLSDFLSFHLLQCGEAVRFSDYTVTPLRANHDPDTVCFIYVIEQGGKTLLYGHDSAYFTEETWEGMGPFRFDCVILDCTCCIGPSTFDSHMGFDDNIRVRRRMIEQGMAQQDTVFIATHFVHTYGPFQEEMEKEMAQYGFYPAFDGYELEI